MIRQRFRPGSQKTLAQPPPVAFHTRRLPLDGSGPDLEQVGLADGVGGRPLAG
jgi:hypothetical protein